MRSRTASHLLAVLALGALALVMIVPATFISSASAAEDTCTTTTETPDVSLLKNDQPVSAENTAVAWEMLKLQFDLTLNNGHCAGQTYEIGTPAELRFDSGTTWNLNTESGETAATMTYRADEDGTNGRLVITLTDYVESHQDVSLSGWVDTRLTSAITPSSTETLTFNINGEVTTVEVPVGVCEGNCTEMPSYLAKFGSAPAPDADGVSAGSVTIQTPTVTPEMAAGADSVTLNWSDELTSPDQTFTCSATAHSYTGRNEWGDPTGGTAAQVNVTSCTDKTISGTVVIPAGQFARITLPMNFRGAGPWTDTASLVFGSNTLERETEVILRNGGGSASGNVPVVPTPSESPAPSTTPSESPTPTESATPSESPSATPSESESPAATASATPSTSRVVVTTSSTPSPHRSLARTGANSLVLVLGAGSLLIAGAVALQRARARE
ncbi:Ig-like domain-containing protein [Actinomyces glycerinitolerans]|uniref:SDR-like Ig domain-containing protein n=1 Tax=Actinomyces glycerinitolerans TaxID=1892869 RepID=A0A1M4RXZ6_9ACTO|nr:Ig-like domain-containing protein [Actinomyces glycerinitolerans]SHE24828.1 Hypothetical protein ACGLYG10_1038 [Actinomyces glycerinitolerans]